MHPKLFELPFGITITTYGFCLMVGFLTAVWFAMRRATRVGANADHVLDLSFVALLAGVGGARIMYVMHYWRTNFADQPNKLLAIIDIRKGGLEFLGGLLGAALAILIFLMIKKLSIRLYLDILAPGAMWGLAFGRLGCYFNGCCFGGLCHVETADNVIPPYAVEFPYGSLAHARQWEERKIAVPAELINTSEIVPSLVPGQALAISVEEREGRVQRYKDARDAYKKAVEDKKPAAELEPLKQEALRAKQSLRSDGLDRLLMAMNFRSREVPGRKTSVSELEALAESSKTRPIYATQIFSSVHGFVLSLFLSAVFYYRKRHGVVIGLLFLMYPVARVLLEMIRSDNPHDIGGLTVSTSLSLAMSISAAIYLIVLFRSYPEISPAAAAESAASGTRTSEPRP
ncbi:MAG: prolipoprotein diacylglyceryl transferase [Planctomycetota bacterium]|jgi:phosphatidylglycerol:prolipoprotein diacylglycerol transferase